MSEHDRKLMIRTDQSGRPDPRPVPGPLVAPGMKVVIDHGPNARVLDARPEGCLVRDEQGEVTFCGWEEVLIVPGGAAPASADDAGGISPARPARSGKPIIPRDYMTAGGKDLVPRGEGLLVPVGAQVDAIKDGDQNTDAVVVSVTEHGAFCRDTDTGDVFGCPWGGILVRPAGPDYGEQAPAARRSAAAG